MVSGKLKGLKILLPDSPSELTQKAAQIFADEANNRTGLIVGAEKYSKTADCGNYIMFCEEYEAKKIENVKSKLDKLPQTGAEGYKIYPEISGGGAKIIAAGNDGRGVIYAAGKLLRSLCLKEGSISIADGIKSVSITPDFPVRGHQLGYRSKNNTYDAWNFADFKQYIIDCIIFGANTIELLPPRSDDDLFSELFPVDPTEMMRDLSELIHSYGMEVSVWYPNMGGDYSDPAIVAKEYAEREKIFSCIPYIDSVMIPGGDPGDEEPEKLFALTEDYVKLCRKYHPNVKFYLSPQNTAPDGAWMDDFYKKAEESGHFLAGVSHGPWIRDDIPAMKSRLPEGMPVRNYPDISHSLQCQYHIGNMATAYRMVYGREAVNPRPAAFKHIHNMYEGGTIGSVTYSEGVHDDFNKMIWCDQDFTKARPVIETVRDYVRFFISPDDVDEITDAVYAIEQNWEKPITSGQADDTFDKWLKIEKKLGEKLKKNYRYQMLMLRAYGDKFVKMRCLQEAELEEKALSALAEYPSGCDKAMDKAWFILDEKSRRPAAEDLRDKVKLIGDILNRLIKIQLDVRIHRGTEYSRGAHLEVLEIPLNNYQYLTENFKMIYKLPAEKDKTAAIEKILNRKNPGEGGFYTNFCVEESDFVISGEKFEDDPGYLRSPRFCVDVHRLVPYLIEAKGSYREIPMPMEWMSNVKSIYGTEITVKYEGLDPGASYKIEVVYPQVCEGDCNARLTAGGGAVIHKGLPAQRHTGEWPCWRNLRDNFDPVFEFGIPKEAYKDGSLTLTWAPDDGISRIDVCEAKIIKI